MVTVLEMNILCTLWSVSKMSRVSKVKVRMTIAFIGWSVAAAPVTGAEVVNEMDAVDLQLQPQAAFVSADGVFCQAAALRKSSGLEMSNALRSRMS